MSVTKEVEIFLEGIYSPLVDDVIANKERLQEERETLLRYLDRSMVNLEDYYSASTHLDSMWKKLVMEVTTKRLYSELIDCLEKAEHCRELLDLSGTIADSLELEIDDMKMELDSLGDD